MRASGLGITDLTFRFFAELADHNDTGWFDANREDFHQRVRAPFIAFLEQTTELLADQELALKGGEQTVFRMVRDRRFTDDPRPYLEQISGLLTDSGTKDEHAGVAYAQLDAGGGMAMAGFHQMSASALKPIRQRIIDEADTVDGIRATLAKADVAFTEGDPLKGMPRGFASHAEHRHADLLARTTLGVTIDLPKSCWLDDTAPERMAAFIVDATPFLRFCRDA